jgi:hypothetical protein
MMCAMVVAGVAQVAGALTVNFSDGFETPTFDPFWSKTEIAGSISLSSSGQVHSGSQAARFTSTHGTGEKYIYLRHNFGELMWGRFSLWVYDSGADVSSSNYLTLYAGEGGNTLADKTITTMDYDLGPTNGGMY